MRTIYVKPNDPTVAGLIAKTFGAFSGRDVAVSVHDFGGLPLTSYWSGGTREYHKIVKLDDMTVVSVPENGSGYTGVDAKFGPSGLPLEMPAPGYAVVTLTDGSYKALAVHIHIDNSVKMLTNQADLTFDERTVLVATRSLKSFARLKQAQYYTGITEQRYEAAKTSLIARGFLNRQGAITTEGKNQAGGYQNDLYRLGQELKAKSA